MQVVFLPVNNTGRCSFNYFLLEKAVYFEGEKKDFWKLTTENQTLNSKQCQPSILDKVKPV